MNRRYTGRIVCAGIMCGIGIGSIATYLFGFKATTWGYLGLSAVFFAWREVREWRRM